MGVRPPEVRLLVRDLDRSAALYRRLGFEDARDDDPSVRCLAHGDNRLILSDHPYGRSGQFSTSDVGAVHAYWEEEGVLVIAKPQQAGARRVFHGLDPDGYELRFEERRPG